ncbi:MAG: tRNA lysidine(34) synthetase TilS [Ruminococcaceae bacterium]|nr:tRNA lysidine(34) synthetase TilS [Oscillospiraceae bacterium]
MPTSLSFEHTTENFENGSIGRTMREHGTVIIGYSGGADSSCLLHLMIPWCRDNGIRLCALHVNHMIRGDEADADEDFCRRTCDELGIELFVRRVDVPAYAKENSIGLEEAARKIRYSLFDEISEIITGRFDGAAIATAHNADDNLETVIFNMLRGSGSRGLGGISPVRDGRFVRPLIRDSSENIRNWCKESSIPYVVDSTNKDTDYTRNHIRHAVVPEMKKICQSPEVSASRLTSLLRQDDDYIESECRKYFSDGDTSISREDISGLHTALSSRILRHLYANAKKSDCGASLAETHISKILSCIAGSEGEITLSLPGGVAFFADRKRVGFSPEDQVKERTEGVLFSYPNDGEIYRDDTCTVRFSLVHHKNHRTDSIDNNKEENIYKLSTQAVLCFGKIKGTLSIRHRENGDVYRFGGMNHKVKKLLCDRKLTSHEKDSLPIISDDDGIVWIPSFPPRDGMSALHGCDGDILIITAESTR